MRVVEFIVSATSSQLAVQEKDDWSVMSVLKNVILTGKE